MRVNPQKENMMRFQNILLSAAVAASLLCGSLFAFPFAARAQDAPTKEEFQAMYDKIASATRKRDLKPIKVLLASNRSARGLDGKTRSREDWLKAIEGQFKSAK